MDSGLRPPDDYLACDCTFLRMEPDVFESAACVLSRLPLLVACCKVLSILKSVNKDLSVLLLGCVLSFQYFQVAGFRFALNPTP